jgi:hypothetical protein
MMKKPASQQPVFGGGGRWSTEPERQKVRRSLKPSIYTEKKKCNARTYGVFFDVFSVVPEEPPFFLILLK